MEMKELERVATLSVNDVHLTEKQYFIIHEDNTFSRRKIYIKDDKVIAVCFNGSSLAGDNSLYMDADFALNPRVSLLKEFLCMRCGVPQRYVKLFDAGR